MLEPKNKAEFEEKQKHSRQIHAAFGQVVSVLLRAPPYRHHPLSDLEWLVQPAIITGQFLIVDAEDPATGVVAPIATALWAFVSDDVDKKLQNQLDDGLQIFRLTPDDWVSGTKPWLLAVVGPPDLIGEMIRRIETEMFGNREYRSWKANLQSEPNT